MGMFTEDEINRMNENNVGHYFTGVFGTTSGSLYFQDLNFYAYSYYRLRNFTGFIDAIKEKLDRSNVSLRLGEAPTKVDEIAIIKFIAESLVLVDKDINSISDLIGKEYNAYMSNSSSFNGTIKITGIHYCGSIPEKYNTLKDNKNNELEQEFEYYL
jgi:hypothetical protein